MKIPCLIGRIAAEADSVDDLVPQAPRLPGRE